MLSNPVNYYSILQMSVLYSEIYLYSHYERFASVLSCQLSLEKLPKCYFFILIYCIGFCYIPIDFALYHIIRIFLVEFLLILDNFLFFPLDHHNWKKTAMTFSVTFFFLPEDECIWELTFYFLWKSANYNFMSMGWNQE